MSTKSITRFLSLFTSVLMAISMSFADHHEEGEHEDESPLHEAMETMGDVFKPFMRAMRAPNPDDKDRYLDWLQEMQTQAVISKVHVPRYFEELSEEEAATMLVSFRVDMTKFIGSLLELEKAILEDDWETAKTLAADLKTHRKEGHKAYDPEE